MLIEQSTCPYCKEQISSTAFKLCSVCKTAQHLSCWKDAQRCSVFGCTGTYVNSDSLKVWYKRIFVSFVSVFIARILILIFFTNSALLEAQPESFVRGLEIVIITLSVLYFILYVAYGIWTVRVARYLKKEVLLYGAYFVFLSVILLMILGTQGFVGMNLISNAITGTILSVYWLLSRELDPDSESLSLYR